MTEPATREDLEAVRDAIIKRIDAMDQSVEGMRSQNSAEHGSLYFILQTIRDTMNWIRAKWEKFTK
jgi:hypothetical protein